MKNLKLLLLSIFTVFLFSGCTSVVLDVVDALDPNQMEDDWAHKGTMRELMKSPQKVLLNDEEKEKASRNICNLKYLRKIDPDRVDTYRGKKFCNIKKSNQIYFLKEVKDYMGLVKTSYLLVENGVPIESIQIERVNSDRLQRSFPIVERLH